MLCIRGTSHGPVSARPSVCPCVTSRSSTKTVKRRITQTTPHDSPGTLVFSGLRKFRRRRRFDYDTLPPTKPPSSYHRFGQDLLYK